MVQFAIGQNNQKMQLAELWKLCFGDTQSYIDLFFENRFNPSQCAVGLLEDEIVAMLFMLPIEIAAKDGTCYAASYIFAVATHPAHRNKGYSRRLLEFAHNHLSAKGQKLAVLVPATEDLFYYYKRQGYQTQFYTTEKTYHNDVVYSPATDMFCKTTLMDILSLRNKILSQQDLFGKWSRDALAYNQQELEFVGGQVVFIKNNADMGYAVCYPDKDAFYIKELLYTGVVEDIIPQLMGYLQTKKVSLRLPPSGETKPFAMTKWYGTPAQVQCENSYIGLVLD